MQFLSIHKQAQLSILPVLLLRSSPLVPLVFVGVGVPHGASLLAGSPGGGKAQGLLDVLPDRHGAEDVEEDEAAVSHVLK